MKKILSFLTLALLVVPTLAIANFSDVDSGTYYKDSIDWLTNEGVIYGHPDGTFKPDDCVNRAEFLKMLFKATESEWHMSEIYYPDVPVDAWYQEYVSYFSSHGVVQGYPDGNFRPSKCVNRAEAIKMATLGFDRENVNGAESLYAVPYDVSLASSDSWWYKYVQYVLSRGEAGIDHVEYFEVDYGDKDLNKMNNPRYNYYPSDDMSRKEVAEMLFRLKTVNDNNLEFGYIDGEFPNEIVPKFDGCGDLDDYQNEDWYEEFVNSATGALSIEDTFIEGCYSASGGLLVFIERDGNIVDECGNVMIYDIEQDWLKKVPNTVDEFYACEFGKRVGDYIEVISTGEFDNEEKTCYKSKLFFLEDRLNIEYLCTF